MNHASIDNYKIKIDHPLQPFNTLQIKAKAAYFSAPTTLSELRYLLNDPCWRSMPKLVLGGGSNVLFTQNYPGLVIKNELKGIDILRENDNYVWLNVAAGENWQQLVCHCIERGYGGIENLSSIPGTVGAAPIQNIGAYGVEVASVFQELKAIELSTGRLIDFDKQACQFSYRNSFFKNNKNRYCITAVTFRLNKRPVFNISYAAVQETLQAMGVQPSLQSISQAITQIRGRRLPNPQTLPNAGSFFKNPVVGLETFLQLQDGHSNIPHYPAGPEHVKIAAGWLIEQCGWKGRRVGKVGVHAQHALVLINHDQGSGAELKQLAEAIQQSVRTRFKIELQPEVNII